ncbi:hypothetical protein K435DRAFT_793829 [Dendrothele bispora CBS 962.96]|uniref:F-box domain-containing protein n=1 Tax=Dendrothele bispora (strain CBS 962.96) TaxID=1314807 RepID=A0A4S8MER7_DENBC|nr:hypothetical protein K435DRAFT_793829 [Dendrothele bispora CBS 962.96]
MTRTFSNDLDVEPPLSLEDLPDELLHPIFEFLDVDEELRVIAGRSRWTMPYYSDSTLYRMSLVNHRLRRLSLPILFKNICFELRLQSDDAYGICDTDLKREVQRLMKALKCWDISVCIMFLLLKVFDRNLSIIYYNGIARRPYHWNAGDYSKDLETSLIVDFLSRCTNLEHLELPRHIVFGDVDNQHPMIEALNRHPSDKLRLKFQYLKERSSVSEHNSGKVNALRHPLLEKIRLEPGHEHDNTPWGVTFAKRMHPYSCKVFHPNRSMAVVKVDNEWLYEQIVVTFQDDIPHGGVGIVEAMIQKLRTTLSPPPHGVFAAIGIDFLSPVGEYMKFEALGLRSQSPAWEVSA